VNGRYAAGAAALGTLALAAAQELAPGLSGYHTWQYVAALAITMTIVWSYAWSARKGVDGERGVRLAIACVGVLLIGAAAIVSGLIGPDDEKVSRAPGSVAPLPSLAMAAFFPVAERDELARGDAGVVLRRRDGSEVRLAPGGRAYLGSSIVTLAPQLAAYVEARDGAGHHLTVTQPTSGTFLSPVLFFSQHVPIAGKLLPADSFAVPAAQKIVKIFYFSAADAATVNAHGIGKQQSVLFAVDDAAGTLVPGAIGFAKSGETTELGGLRLDAVLGTYPSLEIAAAPAPAALWLGAALAAGGLVYAWWPELEALLRRRRAPRSPSGAEAG